MEKTKESAKKGITLVLGEPPIVTKSLFAAACSSEGPNRSMEEVRELFLSSIDSVSVTMQLQALSSSDIAAYDHDLRWLATLVNEQKLLGLVDHGAILWMTKNGGSLQSPQDQQPVGNDPMQGAGRITTGIQSHNSALTEGISEMFLGRIFVPGNSETGLGFPRVETKVKWLGDAPLSNDLLSHVRTHIPSWMPKQKPRRWTRYMDLYYVAPKDFARFDSVIEALDDAMIEMLAKAEDKNAVVKDLRDYLSSLPQKSTYSDEAQLRAAINFVKLCISSEAVLKYVDFNTRNHWSAALERQVQAVLKICTSSHAAINNGSFGNRRWVTTLVDAFESFGFLPPRSPKHAMAMHQAAQNSPVIQAFLGHSGSLRAFFSSRQSRFQLMSHHLRHQQNHDFFLLRDDIEAAGFEQFILVSAPDGFDRLHDELLSIRDEDGILKSSLHTILALEILRNSGRWEASGSREEMVRHLVRELKDRWAGINVETPLAVAGLAGMLSVASQNNIEDLGQLQDNLFRGRQTG